MISDDAGCLSIGWVGANVLYAQFVGGVSADVGLAHAARIKVFADAAPSLQFYLDASRVTHYDLLAGSAMVRAVLSSRRKFQQITLLTFAEKTSAGEQSLVQALEPMELTRDPKDFEVRLLASAPFARQLIHDGYRVVPSRR